MAFRSNDSIEYNRGRDGLVSACFRPSAVDQSRRHVLHTSSSLAEQALKITSKSRSSNSKIIFHE